MCSFTELRYWGSSTPLSWLGDHGFGSWVRLWLSGCVFNGFLNFVHNPAVAHGRSLLRPTHFITQQRCVTYATGKHQHAFVCEVLQKNADQKTETFSIVFRKPHGKILKLKYKGTQNTTAEILAVPKHHATKLKIQRFLDLSTKWKWMVRFAFRPLYSRRKSRGLVPEPVWKWRRREKLRSSSP